MWSGNRRPGSDSLYAPCGVPENSSPRKAGHYDGRWWSCCDKTILVAHKDVPVLKRRIYGKQPQRHLALDPEQIAGPELRRQLQWFGFWRGDLRKVATSSRELRWTLRLLDRRLARRRSSGFTITERIRPEMIDWGLAAQQRAYRQLGRYLEMLENRPRPASVRQVVASDELMHMSLAFMGSQTAGAACCASRRFQRLAESEEVWRSLLCAHWPASLDLYKKMSSKACYAYRVQMTRDAAERCHDRDHVGCSDWEDSHQWMAEQADRYKLMVEMVIDQKVLLATTLDLSYDSDSEDICALVPAACCIPPMPIEELESGLRMTLTLIRKEDGKGLVVGDRMDYCATFDDGHVLLGLGSSPIRRNFDEALYVLSKHPICNLVLRHRTEHWFLHEATFTPILREEDGWLVGISRVSIGLHGVCSQDEPDRRMPAIVLATWDELAIWT